MKYKHIPFTQITRNPVYATKIITSAGKNLTYIDVTFHNRPLIAAFDNMADISFIILDRIPLTTHSTEFVEERTLLLNTATDKSATKKLPIFQIPLRVKGIGEITYLFFGLDHGPHEVDLILGNDFRESFHLNIVVTQETEHALGTSQKPNVPQHTTMEEIK